MNCEVMAAIRGLQFLEEEDGEQIEVITPAEYYLRNDAHYLIYEEVDEDNGAKTKNMLKYKDHVLELTKKGAVNVHMIFEEQKKNITSYGTPFGNIMIGIDTSRVSLTEQENKISIRADYSMDVNYERLADCKICVDICPREDGGKLLAQ